MKKWFNILSSVKVSEDKRHGYCVPSEFCKMDITGYHINSSFSGMVEIEANLGKKEMYSR